MAPSNSPWKWLLLSNLLGVATAQLPGPISSPIETSLLDNRASSCSAPPSRLHLVDLPYQDYFYSDCQVASQVVVTTPQPDSNLKLIGPRLLVAWAAGNSGVVSFFKPANGKNGTLAIKLKKRHSGEFLKPVYDSPGKHASNNNPRAGISGILNFNSSAVLDFAILGSIRTIRDFTEGPSIRVPEIQKAIKVHPKPGDGAILTRLWLDNKTSTHLTFTPIHGARKVKITGKKVHFSAGDYRFRATFNYPQLVQLSASSVLNQASQGLITQDAERTKSLSFLAYKGKLLAGAWRFLTYFGRDSMISLLLMQPILSAGEGGAIEAVISAVLERILRSSGSACHEETIGDYATYLNMLDGKTSTAPSCSYIMIDTDYYLPVVMNNYFVLTQEGKKRTNAFFDQTATTNFGNRGHKYSYLARRNAENIMHHAGKFVGHGKQTKANLRHLKPKQIVGEWRDSTYGIGGGRIPYDVNTALVPAALRAIASLSAHGFFPQHPDWAKQAAQYAQVWEDETLRFFEVTVPKAEAKSLVRQYVKQSGFKGPTKVKTITDDIVYHGLSLDGNNNQHKVKVMNTDTAFRLFLLNTTNDEQLTSLLTSTATQILTPFPAGLSTDVGLLVANPAYGGNPVYARNFTTADYHGTVVWGWPMAMMAKGLEQQLGRCKSVQSGSPAFCKNKDVYDLVKNAYNHLWDIIEANKPLLSFEVWSWRYDTAAQKFKEVDLGALTPTESDIRQLWSLTFLAVKRNGAFNVKVPT